MLTQAPMQTSIRVAQNLETRKMERPIPHHMKIMARLRLFFGMPLSDCQSSIMGPKYLCCFSQLWKRFEDWEKHQALSNIKGVVGNRGKITPMIPRIRETQPVTKKSKRLKGLCSLMVGLVISI